LESAIHQIPSGLPPGETLSLTLYSVFTCDPPNFPNCDLTVFAYRLLFSRFVIGTLQSKKKKMIKENMYPRIYLLDYK
jgi:hypothetical protein